MAEGGEDFGIEQPGLDHNLGNDGFDDDEHKLDTTHPFPVDASTPYPSYHGGEAHVLTHLHETTGLPEVPKMEPVDKRTLLLPPKYLSEPLFGTGESNPKTVTGTRKFIRDRYHEVDFSQLEGGGFKIDFENPEMQTGDVVMRGSRGGKERITVRKSRSWGLSETFVKKNFLSLGPKAEDFI